MRCPKWITDLPLVTWIVLLPVTIVSAEDIWHLPEWKARAVVEISQSAGADIDTAAVKVLCQGRASAGGEDYRVVDAQGNALPFQLTFHDARHYSWISFRCASPQPGQRYFIYFDNPQAESAAEQVSNKLAPGAGPPTGSWIPRAGLVFSTIRRPEGENPVDVGQLQELIAASDQRYGARYQRSVSNGHNPFGPSDYYISIYRGWISIPQSGMYKFCTASNEASFSFLDGAELVHWPGRHTEERGMHGEKNAAVELTAGLHYLEYYHEEVTLTQVAFLGWSPPGGSFNAIPESIFTAPHSANVIRYESADSRLPTFEPVILDSIWPEDRHEGQYTRVQFQIAHPAEQTTYRWQFGDGCEVTGGSVEHVYLSLGRYDVTVTATGAAGESTSAWPLEIYEIQHVTDEIKQGRPLDYVRIGESYDPQQLDAASLKELAHLYAEADRPRDALNVGQIFVQKFGDSNPQWTPRVRRLMALCALETAGVGVDEAIANFQASITDATPPAEKIDSLAQLIRLLGIDKQQPEKVEPLLKQMKEAAERADVNDEIRAAYRRALNAAGDVALWRGDMDGARSYYRRIEALRGHDIPEQVRAARVGAYPTAIRTYLASGNYDAALDIVNLWEDTFATEKLQGHTFFWRGTILAQRLQYKDAASYLTRSLALAAGADFESEARWRLAESLEKLGREKEARIELANLLATGLRDEFTEKAREKLKSTAE